MRDVLRALIAAIESGRPAAWCRLVETRGSTPQKAGAAMLVYEDGSQAGTLGGGCVEAEVKRRALTLLAENRSEVCTFQLDSDYGWDDGLIFVGGGHVGKAVADLAADLQFDVWIVDDRPEFVAEERFPRAQRRISGPIDRLLPDLEVTPDSYCLIVTRGHNHDQEALFHLVN